MTILSGNLLRAARVLAGLDEETLAAAAGVDPGAVRSIEAGAGPNGVSEPVARKLRAALEARGIEFTDDGAPGVRLAPKSVEGIPPDQLTTANDI